MDIILSFNKKNIMILNYIFFLKWNFNNSLIIVIQKIILNEILLVANFNYFSFINIFKNNSLVFFSKTKKNIWFKGLYSKNIQYFKYFYIDCDMDNIKIKIINNYNLICHIFNNNCYLNYFYIF